MLLTLCANSAAHVLRGKNHADVYRGEHEKQS